jgi:hypothetical protein
VNGFTELAIVVDRATGVQNDVATDASFWLHYDASKYHSAGAKGHRLVNGCSWMYQG